MKLLLSIATIVLAGCSTGHSDDGDVQAATPPVFIVPEPSPDPGTPGWVARQSPITFSSISFVNAVHGWGIGGGTIYHTADGGGTWFQQLPPPAHENAPYVFRRVQFVDSLHGWIIGTFVSTAAHTVVLGTADGGQTWVTQLDTGASSMRSFQDLSFVSATTGWVVGFSGNMHRTTDGGATWTPLTTGGVATALSFADPFNGWVLGYFNSPLIAPIVRTTDGGATWTPQFLSVPEGMYDIEAASATQAWVVGAFGFIAATSDGVNWAPQSSPTAAALREIDSIGGGAAWIVGESGTILHTTTGGLAWTLQSSPVLANLLSISMGTGSAGWIAAENKVILQTTSGGN